MLLLLKLIAKPNAPDKFHGAKFTTQSGIGELFSRRRSCFTFFRQFSARAAYSWRDARGMSQTSLCRAGLRQPSVDEQTRLASSPRSSLARCRESGNRPPSEESTRCACIQLSPKSRCSGISVRGEEEGRGEAGEACRLIGGPKGDAAAAVGECAAAGACAPTERTLTACAPNNQRTQVPPRAAPEGHYCSTLLAASSHSHADRRTCQPQRELGARSSRPNCHRGEFAAHAVEVSDRGSPAIASREL